MATTATARAASSVRKQTSYTMAEKRAALLALPGDAPYAAVVAVAKARNVKVRTLRAWLEKRETILGFRGATDRPTIGGQGRRETMPFAKELVAHMIARRETEQMVSGPAMVEWIQRHRTKWCDAYRAKSQDDAHALSSLLRMCERVATRHGISLRKE